MGLFALQHDTKSAHSVTSLVLHRSTDAEVMLGQAWRTMKQCLGHVHPKLVDVLVDLAALKVQQKRPTEAQHLLRRGIAMWRQMGAGSHPALLTALDKLANLCSAHGKHLTLTCCAACWLRHNLR